MLKFKIKANRNPLHCIDTKNLSFDASSKIEIEYTILLWICESTVTVAFTLEPYNSRTVRQFDLRPSLTDCF